MEKDATPREAARRDHNMLELQLVDTVTDNDGKKKFTCYIFELKYGKFAKWEIRRRQRQIEDLSKSLQSVYSGVASSPSTLTMFSVEKKSEAFAAYLRQLIYIESYYSWTPFLRFFQFPAALSFLLLNVPKFQGGVTVQGMSARCVCPSKDLSSAILASHEMFQTTIIDSYLSNFLKGSSDALSRLEVQDVEDRCVSIVELIKPINEPTYDAIVQYNEQVKKFQSSSTVHKLLAVKPGEQTPQTLDDNKEFIKSVLISSPTQPTQDLRVDNALMESRPLQPHDPRNSLNFASVLAKGLKLQVTAVAWNEPLNAVGIGFGTGAFMVMYLGPTQFEREQTFINEHSEKILKIMFDEEQNLAITASEDNMVIMFNLKQNRSVARLTIPGKTVTNFLYDQSAKVGYVSNKGQSVYVLDLGSREIDIANKIATELKPPLIGLHGMFKGERKLLFASSFSEGSIKIFTSKNFADKKCKIKTLLTIENVPGCRVLRYKRNRNEIWTAHENGTVKVFTGVCIDFSKIPQRQASPTKTEEKSPGKPKAAPKCEVATGPTSSKLLS